MAVVGQDRPCIVELVSGRHGQDRRRRAAKMTNMLLLAEFPRWFRENIGVGATVHDLRHLFPEAAANLLPCRVKALVFNRVVKQGGDGLILLAAVFEYDAGRRRASGQCM